MIPTRVGTTQRQPTTRWARRAAAATRVAALVAIVAGFMAGCADRSGDPSGPAATAPATDTATTPGAEGTVGTAPPPDSSTAKYGVNLDMIESGGVLRTVEGHTFPLGEHISYVVRTPVGWLYGRNDIDSPVNLLHADGTSVTLPATMERHGLDVPEAPVLSADGKRIAWAHAGTVSVGTLTATGITSVTSSPAGAETYPLLWNGPLVVLGQPYDPGCCGYRRVQYDVWDAAHGNFVPHWTRDILPLYGPVPAGAALFGVHRTDTAGHGCLVQVDGVKDLSVKATACVPGGLMFGSLRGSLSPDGKHLVEGVGAAIQMFDLGTVITTNAAQQTCAGDEPLTWEDNNTALILNQATGQVTRCFVNGTTPATVPGLTMAAGLSARVVPRIG